MAFQQLSVVTEEPQTAYNGPYLSGDEIEELSLREKQYDALWQSAAEDLDR
jgi:hypothetical protein